MRGWRRDCDVVRIKEKIMYDVMDMID